MSLATTDSTPVYENWKSATRVEGSTNMIIFELFVWSWPTSHHSFVLMISHDYQIRHIDNASQVIRISWIWKYRWHLAASSHVGWGPGTVIPRTCCQCPADKTGGRSRRHAAFFRWGSSECAERNQNEESFRPKKQEIRMQLTVFFTDILRIYKSISIQTLGWKNVKSYTSIFNRSGTVMLNYDPSGMTQSPSPHRKLLVYLP